MTLFHLQSEQIDQGCGIRQTFMSEVKKPDLFLTQYCFKTQTIVPDTFCNGIRQEACSVQKTCHSLKGAPALDSYLASLR